MSLYQIVRFYQRDSTLNRVIKENVSLGEARRHCSDPETASSTCSEPENIDHSELYGEWFDGFRKQGE